MPLRLGYVPVVLRGQRDIESKKTVRAAIEHEREVRGGDARARLIASVLREPHCVPNQGPVLVRTSARAVADNRSGVGFLSKKLSLVR